MVWSLKSVIVVVAVVVVFVVFVVVIVGVVIFVFVLVGMGKHSWLHRYGNSTSSDDVCKCVFQNVVTSSKRVTLIRLLATRKKMFDVFLIVGDCCFDSA